ncbi:MAG: DUF2933 domain-containing protein [Egibacteraceae bacterium]
MKLFGMCIDKRVVAGVAAAAGLLWWLAPGAFTAAWPLLIIAICPLSMLLMMKAMNQMGGQSQEPAQPATPPTPDVGAVTAAAADVDARRN